MLRLEVFQHLFSSIAEEMGAALQRSSFSPNIKERRDFSCALFDAEGRTISQAAHIPIHLGSIPLCAQAALAECELAPGDTVVLNDPYRGGTHLPDITLVTPVFIAQAQAGARKSGRKSERKSRRKQPPRAEPGPRTPDFLVANRAHHADVGGGTPGSMAPSDDVHGEGLRIPPVHLVRAGVVQRDVLELLLANMRVPAERRGDLLAQWAANRLGEQRLAELADEHGLPSLQQHAAELMDWTRALVQAEIRALPRGVHRFEDVLELPGEPAGRSARVRVAISARGGKLTVDLRATDDQVQGGVNAPRAVALSAVLYVLRLLLPAGTPTNDGVLRDVEVLTRPGSLVDARYPAAVASGNVETSQRLVDVLLGALAAALPERIPAASAGTMSNLTFGGLRPDGSSFSHYETLAGGAGASAAGAGASAVHTHMTNTRNTPIEALETHLPVRILAHAVRRGSGGAGARRGGEGIEKRILFLSPARLTWVAGRESRGPWGLAGGASGSPGGAALRRRGSAAAETVRGGSVRDVHAGDELSIDTPGGGGHGPAPARSRG